MTLDLKLTFITLGPIQSIICMPVTKYYLLSFTSSAYISHYCSDTYFPTVYTSESKTLNLLLSAYVAIVNAVINNICCIVLELNEWMHTIY